MICQRNLLTLKEDRKNMPLETDGGGIFQFCYRNVIVQCHVLWLSHEPRCHVLSYVLLG